MCGLKFSTYSSKYKATQLLDYMVKLLIYVKDIRIVSGSSFVYKCPPILTPFVEEYPSSIELYLFLCQRSLDHICVGLAFTCSHPVSSTPLLLSTLKDVFTYFLK